MSSLQRDLDRFRREILNVWPLLASLPWANTAFSIDKAYVCAVFSKLAYLKIPALEVAAATSAKVVPCLTYQRLLAAGAAFDFEDYVRRLDLKTFVHFDDYLVVVGVVRPDVIIVAIRGTRILHATDILIDLDVRKAASSLSGSPMKFHRGFYLEITKNLQPITVAIRSHGGPEVPVYVVGHSLGGAMSAIMYAVAGKTFDTFYAHETLGVPNIPVHSSFTFGMPRYGNAEALRLATPFHVYNDRDAIPTVPPQWCGFANAADEYCLAKGRRALTPGRRKPGGLKSFVSRLHWARGIRHHLIERYIRRLR